MQRSPGGFFIDIYLFLLKNCRFSSVGSCVFGFSACRIVLSELWNMIIVVLFLIISVFCLEIVVYFAIY